MVFYFTGTGNSRLIARKIGEVLQDEIVSLNNHIKRHLNEDFNSEKPYVFVLPTYAWRIPRIVSDFINKRQFAGNKKWYFVLTCGSSMGQSKKYIEKLLKKREYELMGCGEIKMPENYIALYKVPDKEKIEKLKVDGLEKAEMYANLIKQEKQFEEKIVSFSEKMLSKFINPIFYKVIVKSEDFYVKDNCVGCAQCQNACPLNNIFMKDKKPVWKHQCTHCMACISICPTKAIEYEGRTETKERYYVK